MVESVGTLMRTSAIDILETMFFLAPEAIDTPERWESPHTGAYVQFNGAQSGRFEALVEKQLAQEMAAGFLGAEDPAEIQPEQLLQVTCEFINMVCGVTLSRMEPDSIFDLNAPCPCPEAVVASAAVAAAVPEVASLEALCWLDCGQGFIRLALQHDMRHDTKGERRD